MTKKPAKPAFLFIPSLIRLGSQHSLAPITSWQAQQVLLQERLHPYSRVQVLLRLCFQVLVQRVQQRVLRLWEPRRAWLLLSSGTRPGQELRAMRSKATSSCVFLSLRQINRYKCCPRIVTVCLETKLTENTNVKRVQARRDYSRWECFSLQKAIQPCKYQSNN